MFTDFMAKMRTNRFDPEYFPVFESKLFFDGEKKTQQIINFTVLLALSTVIATYGVVTDSTAAVIGAMIIAPLMTPIMACAAGVTLGSRFRSVNALRLVALGIIGVIVLSALLTVFLPSSLISFTGNSQITSRVHPSLLDLIIALAAGAAGAYAIGRQEIADSLAGVAIAISLVPPLAVVGISLGKLQWVDAVGSFVLFLTNFFAILLAGAIVFRLLGLHQFTPTKKEDFTHQKAVRVIILGTILIAVILGVATFNAVQTTNEQVNAVSAVNTWIGNSSYQVVTVGTDGTLVDVTIRGEGPLPPIGELAVLLEQNIGHPVVVNLRVVPEQIQRYPVVLTMNVNTPS
jgi:uncharacterized hydrophobic protein (TIGR00271 family)